MVWDGSFQYNKNISPIKVLDLCGALDVFIKWTKFQRREIIAGELISLLPKVAFNYDTPQTVYVATDVYYGRPGSDKAIFLDALAT